MSTFALVLSNGTAEVKAAQDATLALTPSHSLLNAGAVLLIFALILGMCHLVMTGRMAVECWRGQVLPCEEPSAMAVCGVVQLLFAGLPALLLTLWLARVQSAYEGVTVGPGMRLVQAGWWLQLSAWLLLQASCCCAHGGNSGLLQHSGPYIGIAGPYQPPDEEGENERLGEHSSASREELAYRLDAQPPGLTFHEAPS